MRRHSHKTNKCKAMMNRISLVLFYSMIICIFPTVFDKNYSIIAKIENGSFPKFLFAIMTHQTSVDRAKVFHNRFSPVISKSQVFTGPVYFSAPQESLPNQTVMQVSSHIFDHLVTFPPGPILAKQLHMNLALKFVALLKYFVEKTQDDYFFRITDDIFINFNEIYAFLQEVTFIGDPRKNVIVLGQCMHVRNRTLLQGGTGYLFSRRAAEVFLENADEMLRSVDIYEDWVIYSWIQKMIPEPQDTFSWRFLGHGFSREDRSFLLKKNFSTFPECPTDLSISISCIKTLAQLKTTIFFHQYAFYPSPEEWEEMVTNIPDNLMWYQSWYYAQLCLKNNSLDYSSYEARPPNPGFSPRNIA